MLCTHESMIRLRTAIVYSRQLNRLSFTRNFRSVAQPYPPVGFPDAETEAEHREARIWLRRFSVTNIPKSICDLSFSRCSGPGGQNVNKYAKATAYGLSTAMLTQNRVNSKATLSLDMDGLLPLVPKVIHEELLRSKYLTQDNTLVFRSEDARTQVENIKICYQKLHQVIIAAGRIAIRSEASEASKAVIERVEALYVVWDLPVEDH